MSDFYVGQESKIRRRFEREDVIRFAEISGDNNPIHLDEVYAKTSRFGDNIVHGILVSSLISKIIGTQMPGEGSIYVEQNLLFRRPVYIGEEVTAKVVITNLIKEKKIIELETNVYNQKEECVIRGSAKVLYENLVM